MTENHQKSWLIIFTTMQKMKHVILASKNNWGDERLCQYLLSIVSYVRLNLHIENCPLIYKRKDCKYL
jgi:hypothetical protein